jgi:hypothetical protein
MRSKYKFQLFIKPHARLVSSILIVAFCLTQYSCKKQVEVDTPFTSLNVDNVFSSDATAAGILTALYADISSGSFATGKSSISFEAGLSADELKASPTDLGVNLSKFYQNALNNQNGLTFWESFYKYLYTINVALEGVTKSTSLTPAVKQQLTGECKFMRAFIDFYLVNLYGDIPLASTSDYSINSKLSRTAKSQVYGQIIADLKNAESLLSPNYLNGTLLATTTERVRPTKWAASALLSRVYLYNGNLTGDATNYANAESEASTVINNSNLYDTVPLNKVFLKNSQEAIWQLQPVTANQNTQDALIFILTTAPNFAHPAYLSKNLLNSFEASDQRKMQWVNYYVSGIDTFYYPYKYHVVNTGSLLEYSMVLRLGEQYLIRAEARALQNKIGEAQSDLNVIRKRAGLTNTGASDKTSLLAAILHERQIEFFTEWGHRWFDLKRTNSIDAVMGVVTPQKGGTWNTNWQWYPIPLFDLQTNSDLTQNSGY